MSEFPDLKMKPGENPIEFTHRVDQSVQILLMINHVIPQNQILVAMVSGMSNRYDTQRQILCSDRL